MYNINIVVVSGSVAERCTHTAYFTYTALLTAWFVILCFYIISN